MSESRIKKIRKAAAHLVATMPGLTMEQRAEVYNKAIKTLKKSRDCRWIMANIPQNPAPISKKIHSSESYADFRLRRKACNERRRQREKAISFVLICLGIG